MFSILFPVLIILFAFLAIGFVLSRLYKRAPKSRAFIRTGLGGQKVIMDGGAIVLPVFHETMDVNLETLRLDITREHEQAVITLDKMRADISVEFYLNVEQNAQSISQAAQTLGDRTLDVKALRELIEGKFNDAIRSVAATMTLADLQQNRQAFIKNVEETLKNGLATNGLALEHASLVKLDQTDIKYFNPNNSFDAEGLTAITKITAERAQQRNKIDREKEIMIAQQDRDAQMRKITIEQETTQAQVEQEQNIANMRASSRAVVAAREAEARQAEAEAAITSDRSIEIARQDTTIALAGKRAQTANAERDSRAAEAAAVAAAESVTTAKDVAIAERDSKISVIQAERKAKSDAVAITVKAATERQAAIDYAEARRAEAQGQADAAKLEAEAALARATAEAEGLRQINAAKNVISPEIMAMQIRMKTLEVLPEIIKAAVEPIRNIGSVSIVDTGNMRGNFSGQTIDGETNHGSTDPMSHFMDAIMKYQFQAPVIKTILSKAGIQVDDKNNMVSGIIESAVAGAASGTAAATLKGTNVEPVVAEEPDVGGDANKTE